MLPVATINYNIFTSKGNIQLRTPTHRDGTYESIWVSRTAVREAISRLQASHIVETKHGIGTFIKIRPSEATHDLEVATVASKSDMNDLLVLRRTLEKDAVITSPHRCAKA